MSLPREYGRQSCSMSRALEIVGERWSLLVIRDAFFGVRRFSDFVSHLGIPRAVLTERLDFLVAEGVFDRVPGPGRRFEYELTGKGLSLWPAIRALTEWGDEHYAPRGPRRLFEHTGCGGAVDPAARCATCGEHVPVSATTTAPGPGYEPRTDPDPVSVTLSAPWPMLAPINS